MRRSILCENERELKTGVPECRSVTHPVRTVASSGLSYVLGTGKEHVAHTTSYTYAE